MEGLGGRVKQDIIETHNTDEKGNPTGGTTTSTGLDIRWQDGALVVDGKQVDPNGAFLQTVLSACIGRLQYYQAGKFACRDNAVALTHLETAQLWLGKREAERAERGVLGTHEK